jgi:fimbrial isopeptide formation D2 family protein/uncharacterized repeat protein (TIGR01451 family)
MAILLGGSAWGTSPLLAQSAPPGLIKNTATGSFVDELDPTNTEVPIQSNEVSVTVIEVAGISIKDPTISEPTATIIGATAAPFQGIGGINQNDILYFDFEIFNKGNDPTQFFIPGSPFGVINGTFDRSLYGAVQIIQIKNATGAIVPLAGNVTTIDIPAAGANTGDLTILGIPLGSIPAGGSVTVRIPVKVTGGSGASIKVALGDTNDNDNGAGTVNQTYTASTTTGADVRTKDNPNNLTPDTPVAGETDGVLATSAEKEASRFRIVPIVATPQVIGFKSAKLTDSNTDTKINPGETVTWTIDYVNTGLIDVSNFQITDILPTGVTKSGNVTLSVGGSGQATPTVNSGYTGTNTTPGTTDQLFTAPITLKAGGTIKVAIPVTIDTGIIGTLSNQATATADNLPSIGITTDNAGITTDLPTAIQNPPYSIVVPGGSVNQTTTAAIDPTTITVEAVASNPNLLLVKRITAINGLPSKNGGGSLASYEHFDAYDNNYISIPTRPLLTDPQKDTDKWPDTISTSETDTTSTFLIGASNGGTTKPNDTVEYTIYFLSAGDSEAKNVLICDRVPANVTFSPNAFTNTTTNPTGIARGIAVQLGNTLNYYTNANDSDPARYFPPGIEPSTVYPNISCGKNAAGVSLPNDNGAVVVNLGNRPNATGILADDQAAGAYGFVRFRGQVK